MAIKHIGILTAGGDSPGLNAAIRAIGKAALRRHGINVTGFLDGFRGLMENRTVRFDTDGLSGILTRGGTVLGTSRDKPHKMEVGGKTLDMTDLMLENFERNQLDVVICIGGGGTMKNALKLAQRGMRVITLPKTIDNDVWGTDTSFGFDTALGIATEAVDRLHSTAHSHHRIMVVEIMGHNTGWLTLGAGLAGGADEILIPELPYEPQRIADTILTRVARGSTFSIIAVAEGAMSRHDSNSLEDARSRARSDDREEAAAARKELREIEAHLETSTHTLAHQLNELTNLEARVTILGHVQRGGTPSSPDRLLATQLGTASADLAAEGRYGIMVASRDGRAEAVPLEEVAGKRKTVPLDHPWIRSAKSLGIGLGNGDDGS